MTQLVRCAVAALAFAMAPGCSTNRYAGIDLRPGAAPLEVQAMARDARNGDKRAQFTLGERYEQGAGVPVDQRRATELYRAAASDSGGVRMMFLPQGNGAVSTVPINSGPVSAGLPEAQAKLVGLRESASSVDSALTLGPAYLSGKPDEAPSQARSLIGDRRLEDALDNLEGSCSFSKSVWTSFRSKRFTLVRGRASVSDAALAGWPITIPMNYDTRSYIVLSVAGQPSLPSKMGDGLVQRAIASGRLSRVDVDCFSLGTFRGIIVIDRLKVFSKTIFSKIQAGI